MCKVSKMRVQKGLFLLILNICSILVFKNYIANKTLSNFWKKKNVTFCWYCSFFCSEFTTGVCITFTLYWGSLGRVFSSHICYRQVFSSHICQRQLFTGIQLLYMLQTGNYRYLAAIYVTYRYLPSINGRRLPKTRHHNYVRFVPKNKRLLEMCSAPASFFQLLGRNEAVYLFVS